MTKKILCKNRSKLDVTNITTSTHSTLRYSNQYSTVSNTKSILQWMCNRQLCRIGLRNMMYLATLTHCPSDSDKSSVLTNDPRLK